MKAVVVYDSKFGNTERLAQAIAEQLGMAEPAEVVAASAACTRDLAGIDLLAVGGPTQGHGLSPAVKAFLERIPPDAVRDLAVVTFDTRLHGPQFLTGSAATSIAKRLTKKGARLLVPPESFLVAASEGPLADGELARAQAWAHQVRAMADRSAQVSVGAAI